MQPAAAAEHTSGWLNMARMQQNQLVQAWVGVITILTSITMKEGNQWRIRSEGGEVSAAEVTCEPFNQAHMLFLLPITYITAAAALPQA